MQMTEGAEAGEAGLMVEIGAGQRDRGEAGLLVEIGAGQRDIGREQQLVWRMWLGSIKELHPGRGRYKSMLASRREL